MFFKLERLNIGIAFGGGSSVVVGEKVEISGHDTIVRTTETFSVANEKPSAEVVGDLRNPVDGGDTTRQPPHQTRLLCEGEEYLILSDGSGSDYLVPSPFLSGHELAFTLRYDRDEPPAFNSHFSSPGVADLKVTLNGDAASIRLGSLSANLKAVTLRLNHNTSVRQRTDAGHDGGHNACAILVTVDHMRQNDDVGNAVQRCALILALSPAEPNGVEEPVLGITTIRGGRENITFNSDFRVVGEGQFGIVYSGTDPRGRLCAIKIFFERQFSTTTGTLSVSQAALRKLRASQVPTTQEIKSGESEDIFFNDLYRLLFENGELVSPAKKPIDTAKVLKMFVDSSAQRLDLIKTKLEAEWEATKKIIENQTHGREVRYSGHFVDAIGYSDKFTKSKAFRSLLRSRELVTEGGAQTSNLSNYAIVMEFCSDTLQDLLQGYYYRTHAQQEEKKGPTWYFERMESRDGKCRPANPCTGYWLIRQLTAQDRIIALRPFILGVLDGLSDIHSVEILHHDIKPANVFIQKEGNSATVKLGDFSFAARLAERTATTEPVLRDVIQTGTAHYKSPEQRDFVESYYVQIGDAGNSQNPDGTSYNLCLEVLDPKFAANFVGAGDRVVFGCDKSGQIFQVASLPIPCSEKPGLRVSEPQLPSSTLAANQSAPGERKGLLQDLGNALSNVFTKGAPPIRLDKGEPSSPYSIVNLWQVKVRGSESDMARIRSFFGPSAERRLVHFFKIPSLKTDIYGVGSLCFDLFTGGSSPQRFYETIRGIDWNQRALNMSDVIKKYADYTKTGQSDSKSFDLVFNQFRCADNTFPPEWFVQFMFRCLTYYIPDNPWGYENVRGQRVNPSWAIAMKRFFSEGFRRQLEDGEPKDRWLDDSANILIYPNESRILRILSERQQP